MPRSADLLTCSFCGKSQKQVKTLIAGPDAYICDGCMSRAHAVISGSGDTVSTPIAMIHRVPADARAEQCGFCGKQRRQVAAMVSAGDTRVICDECLELCDEIVREQQSPPRP